MATTVEPGYAAWLAAPCRNITGVNAAIRDAYGDNAVASEVISPLAFKADAIAEANAQALFLAGPLARDKVTVAGLRKDLIGRVVTVTGSRLGYELGADVFVIGVAEADAGRTTTLTVLKRL